MMAEKYAEGINLKMQYFPQSFFKYRKLNSRTIDSIKDSKIWLAEIASLNDPFECSVQFDNNECLRLFFSDKNFLKGFKEKFGVELSNNEMNEIVNSEEPYLVYSRICISKNIELNISPEKQLIIVQKRWAEIVDQTNKNLRICCFSEFNDSLLMWSHYADEHKGVCIEYDFKEEDEIRSFLQPIDYRDKIYKINIFEDLTALRQIGASLTKCKAWEYEAEWRLTIQRRDNFLPDKISVPLPIAIYLGTRFYQNEDNVKKQFMEVIEEHNIPIYQIKKHSSEYRLIK